MVHGVTFDLTPKFRLRTDGNVGEQKLTIEGRDIPLEFDGRKFYLNIRVPSEQEIITLPTYDLTSPMPFNPEDIVMSRRNKKRKYKPYPGGLSMELWRQILDMAPEDVVRKTFDATTQLCMSVEAENRAVGRRHFKSRFPILKEKRLRDVFTSGKNVSEWNTSLSLFSFRIVYLDL